MSKKDFYDSVIILNFREKEAILNGETSGKEGQMPSNARKTKTMKRIQEYEKFEANCQRIKELEKGERTTVSRDILCRHNTYVEAKARKVEERRAKLEEANCIPDPHDISTEKEFHHREIVSNTVLLDVAEEHTHGGPDNSVRPK